MSTESSPTQKTGGQAWNVIIAPATKLDSPCLTPKGKTPRPESAEDIEQKQLQASERKKVREAEKLSSISKNRERAQEAIDRLRAEEEKIKVAVLEKHTKKLEICEEKREQKIQKLRARLRNHLKHVEEVCQKSSLVTCDLEERIQKKYEAAEEKRRLQIESLLTKLREHAKHIEEVCKSSESKCDAQKMIEKMEAALKRREENLQALHERLQEHEKHIQEVRNNKLGSGDSEATDKENQDNNQQTPPTDDTVKN